MLLVVLAGCQLEGRRSSGLDGIQAEGVLRVIVRPGLLEAPRPGDGRVDQVTLVQQLAGRLGVGLRWVEASRHDQIVPWLIEGRGDIAVARLSPAALLGTGASPTTAIDWVEDLLVAGPRLSDFDLARNVEGEKVHLAPSLVTVALAKRLEEAGLTIVPVPEDVSVEELFLRVSGGRYGLTVADSDLVDTAVATLQIRSVGHLGGRRPLVWALRESNGRLRRAVDDFLFAERVLGRAARTAACRDLDRIKHARVLRFITRNSPTTCSVERGGLAGFEYGLGLAFARDLGLRLGLEIPPPGVDPLDFLEDGYGDILALHEPMAPEDERRFLVSEPYRSADLVSVLSIHRPIPAAVEDLAGESVVAAGPVARLISILPLGPPMAAAEPHPGADGLAALHEVSLGRARFAVVDEDTARLELADRSDLQLGPTVLPEVPLVWVMNSSSPQLYRRVNEFLRKARLSGLVRQITLSELGNWTPVVAPHIPEVPPGGLTPYDELLLWVGREQGIDWRLLASLMYEESRFDPDAIGPGGSAGLFQFMPFTWPELGVEDPHHPGEAVEAGGTYLRWLMDKFSDLELPEQVAMGIASYNVGPRHVFDARRLAVEMGLDPDRWSGNVETAMLILENPEVARRFPAGVCRCRRAVGYTRRILRRYRAYTEQFPPS